MLPILSLNSFKLKPKPLDLLPILRMVIILGVDCLKGCRRDLGDSIETDKQCQQLEAAGKIDIAESEALHAVNGTEANGRKHQAETYRRSGP